MSLIKRNSLKIIEEEAKKEYKNFKTNNDTYTSLQNSIIFCLEKEKPNIKEIKFRAEQEKQWIEMFNFENFIGVRIGLYSFGLALVAIIFSQPDLIHEFNISLSVIKYFLAFIVFIIVTSNLVTNHQKHRLIYLRFILQCIDKIYK